MKFNVDTMKENAKVRIFIHKKTICPCKSHKQKKDKKVVVLLNVYLKLGEK